MKNQFQYKEAPTPAPIRIEQVWAEKPKGGLLKDAGYDVVETTPVGLASDGYKYQVIKQAKVKTKYTTGTSLVIEKGSGIKANEFIAFGKIAKKVTIIDTTSAADKDTITLESQFDSTTIEVGDFLFQAKKTADGSTTVAEPIVKPLYIVSDGNPRAANGIVAFAGEGDTPVRLINGANVRKETCNFGAEIEALLPGVHRV